MKILSERFFFRYLAIAVITAAIGWSQQPGQLTGKVTDMLGQGVGRAEIRLKNASGTVVRTMAAEDGIFTFDSLPAGSYTVEIESAGRTQSSTKTLEINRSAPSSIELVFDDQSRSAGSATGTIEIKAAAPTIQADSAEISRAYNTRLVRSLPLIDRQNQELISLMPGVTPPVLVEDRIVDPQRSRLFNVNGLPDFANAYFQDGSYQNENYSGKQSRIAPNSSVQQLNIRTSNYNAEHGFSAGAAVNTVTRPGTNSVHGSLFGLHTNSFLTTRNPVNFGPSTPNFNVNQFGGSAGGSIIKDKTFWFLAYEGYLRRGGVLQIATVPDQALRTGNFSQVQGLTIFNPNSGLTTGANRTPFPGNRIPTSSLNPVTQRILAELPAANLSGSANNLVGSALLREDQHRMDGKVDHRFSEKSTGFLRYGFTHGSVDRASIMGPLGDGAQAGMRNHNAVASLTQSLSNTLAAEFRVGYSRFRNAISPFVTDAALAGDLAARGFNQGLPQISIVGFGSYGLPANYPSKPVNNTFDAATNWNWHNGMHHLKIGAQAIHIRADGFDVGAFSPRGSFFFAPGGTSSINAGTNNSLMNPALNSFAAFLTGTPTVSGISSFEQTPTYRQTLTSAYLTDTINLWKNVHLELGVRYDVFSPLRTRRSNAAVVFDGTNNQLVRGDGTGEYDFNNIAPRVGIVVRPIERMAIRAGYGIHYFSTPFAYSGINQASVAAQAGMSGGFTTTPFSIPMVGSGTSLNPNQPLFTTALDSQTPYAQTYNFMIQSDLGNGILLDLGYVGNLGRQLPYSRGLNIARPGLGATALPFSQFSRTAALSGRGTGLNSNYNSLQANLTKRFGAGLSLAGAYTYGKVLDTGFEQTNPFNTRNNYGPSDFDRTHILAISHLWQLPFGPGSSYFRDGWAAHLLGSWQLNGILRWATGSPYSITADPLLCNCPGLGAVRVVGSSGTAIDGQSGFNPSLFSAPAPGTFGAAGRNSFRGPDFFTYDTSLFRSFPVRENFNLELRAEAYNVTNNTNLANPVSSLSSPAFGRSNRTVNGAFGRQFQVGARILF